MPEAVSVGSKGLVTGVSPLIAPKEGAYRLSNMVSDVPGLSIKRRGMKVVRANASTPGFTSVFSGSSKTLLKPKQVWAYDDHIFVYAEDDTAVNSVVSGIAAYSMVTNAGWHKVVESSSYIALDRDQFKMKFAAVDRRQLLTTATGIKRIAGVYSDYYPLGSTTAVNYSSMYRDAGIPRALDPRCPNAVAGGASLPGLIAVTGYEWLEPSSAVAYEICWFKRDENGTPGIGAPSGRCVIRNTSTTTSYATRLKIPIPAGCSDSSYVMQIYRTLIISMDGAGVIPDPGQDMFLAGEYRLTSTDLSNKYVLYEDISIDGLLKDALYTNETQDGAGQARFQPPMARDIAMFGQCSFFANLTERNRLIMRILAVDSTGAAKGIRVGDMIVAGDLVMEAVAVANEETQLWYFAVDATAGAGSEVIRAIKTAESFVYKYNLWSNSKNGRYYAYNLTGNSDIVGVVGFEEKSIGGSTGVYLGVNRVDSPVQILPIPVFTTTPANTLAQACAVATDAGPTTVTVTSAAAHNLTTNDLVFLAPFANSTDSGTSSPKLVNTDVPSGVYKITVSSSTVFTFPSPSGSTASQTDARTATTGGYFHKIFDSATSTWTEARNSNNRKINRMMWSPALEPESAPVENSVDVGAADRAILRVVPTQDSMFIFKEDGVWRLKGEAGDWELIILDSACVLCGQESPAIVDGIVYCYSTNGVVSVDDGGTAKISGNVGGSLDSFYRSFAASPSVALGYVGAGHQEDRAYWLLTGGILWRYHVPSRSWSQHLMHDSNGFENVPSCMATVRASRYTSFDSKAYINRLVVGNAGDGFNTSTGNTAAATDSVMIERRSGRIDELCDTDIPVTFSSKTTTTVTLSSVPSGTEIGDVLLNYSSANYAPGEGVIASSAFLNRATISAINSNTLTLVIQDAVPTLDTWSKDSWAIMKQINTEWAPTPIAVGDGLRLGHFSEVILQTASRGRFSVASFLFNTESGISINDGAQSTGAVSGYAYDEWAVNYQTRNEITMPEMRAFRCDLPRESASGTYLICRVRNNRAFEQFDIAGLRLIMRDGDNKVSRTNG